MFTMKNFFSEIDGVTLTFSDIQVKDNVMEYVDLLFERVKDDKVDYILSRIPGFKKIDSKGFSDSETRRQLHYALKNSALIWDIAREIKGEWLA